MNNGWVKIHRQIQEKGWYSDSEFVHLWVHFLMKANHEGKEFLFNNEIQKLERGQFISGYLKLEAETGINRRKVEKIVKCFEKDGSVGKQSNNKFSIYTIINYDKYQLEGEARGEAKGKQRGNKGETKGNKQELKELKELKEVKEKKENFGEFENVKLTKEEYEKLKEKFSDWKQKIDKLSVYLKSKGDKYKSHYATILNWDRREQEEKEKNKPKPLINPFLKNEKI